MGTSTRRWRAGLLFSVTSSICCFSNALLSILPIHSVWVFVVFLFPFSYISVLCFCWHACPFMSSMRNFLERVQGWYCFIYCLFHEFHVYKSESQRVASPPRFQFETWFCRLYVPLLLYIPCFLYTLCFKGALHNCALTQSEFTGIGLCVDCFWINFDLRLAPLWSLFPDNFMQQKPCGIRFWFQYFPLLFHGDDSSRPERSFRHTHFMRITLCFYVLVPSAGLYPQSCQSFTLVERHQCVNFE